MTIATHQSTMPWVSDLPEDRRFRRILVVVMTLCFLVSVASAIITLPKPERPKFVRPDENVIKLIPKKDQLKPVKVLELTEEQKAALKKNEEERLKKLEEERKKREEELKKQSELDKKKQDEEAAKKKAEEEKRLAEEKKRQEAESKKLQNDEQKRLAELQRQQKLEQEKIRKAQLEAERQAQAEVARQAKVEAERVARVQADKEAGRRAAQSAFGDLASTIGTTSAPAAAANVGTKLAKGSDAAARNVGGAALPSKTITSATSGIVGKGSGGISTGQLSGVDVGGGGALTGTGTTTVAEVDLGVKGGTDNESTSKKIGGGREGRTSRELNLLMEQYKGKMQAIFERALRKNPSLGGKVVLRMTIQPTGEISAVETSGDIDDQEFIAKLKALVRTIDFGAKDVGVVVANYPVDFAG